MRAQVGRHRYFWGTALTISLLHAIAAVAATREWVPIGSGGSVVALVIDPANPNRAFAATPHGGVFRTDDAGDSWARASAGLPWREIEIFGLAVGESGPPRLYAATNAGVFVSKTAASSWEPTQLPSDGVHVLEVNPSDSNMVIAVTSQRAYRTRDGGMTWSTLPFENASLSRGPLARVLFDPNDASTVYAVVPPVFFYVPGGCSGSLLPDSLLRSRDGGDTWHDANAGIRPLVGMFCCVRGCRPSSTRVIGELAADPHHRGALLALVSAEHAAYRSTNGADSWTPVELDPSESYFESVRFDPSTPGVLYAVRRVPPPSGVFVWATELVRSDDSGASWTVLPAPLSGVTIAAVALAKGAADHILLGTFRGEREGGVLRSVDGGMTWVAVNQGFSGLDVLAMIAHPTRAGTLLVDASFTSDAGTTWTTPAFLPAGVTGFAVDGDGSDGVYAAGPFGLVFAAFFGGSGFMRLPLPFHARSVASDRRNPDRLYVVLEPSAWCNVAVSSNRGSTWTDDFPRFPTNQACSAEKNVVVAPGSPMGAFVGSEGGGGVHRSTDGGKTWVAANVGLPGTVRALVADAMSPAILYAGTPQGVFRTQNAGLEWRPMATGLTTLDVRSLAIDPHDPTVVYAGTAKGGVFRSIRGGRWTAVGSGLDGFDIRALAVDAAVPTRLFAGTIGGGAFRLELPPCGDGVIDASERAAEEITCGLREFAGEHFCANDRFVRFVQGRLRRAMRLIRRPDPAPRAARRLRRVDRLLGRVLAHAQRLAYRKRLAPACCDAVLTGLGPIRDEITEALRSRPKSQP